MVEVSHRLRLRDSFLPDARQTYLELPGVRPDRGPCPECKQPEGSYCLASCDLVDPYAKDSAERLTRCAVCAVAALKRDALHQKVMLNQKRTMRHLVEAGWGDQPGLRSLCHMVRDGMVINGARW